MTQYFDDFGSYSTGGAIATDTGSVWTLQKSSADFTYSIQTVAGSTSGKALQLVYNSGSSGHSNLVRSPPASGVNIEVVARIRLNADSSTTTTGTSLGPVLVAADNGGYGLRRIGADQWRLTRFSTTGTAAANVGGAAYTFADSGWPSGTYIRVRLRRESTGNWIRARIWLDADNEPTGTWHQEGQDSTHSGQALLAGLNTSAAVSIVNVDPMTYAFFGIDDAGGTAPTTGSSPPDTSTDPYLIIPRRQLFVTRRVIQQ